MSLLVISIFLSLYYFLAALRDHYIHTDIVNHSDHLSPERVAWHRLGFAQATLLFVFLCACSFYGLHIHFDERSLLLLHIFRILLIFVFIRSIMMENVKNVIDGGWSNIFYVDRDGLSSLIHQAANKSGIPAEAIAITLRLINLILIILI